MSHFRAPWKRQKTYGFVTFSGGANWNIALNWINDTKSLLQLKWLHEMLNQ